MINPPEVELAYDIISNTHCSNSIKNILCNRVGKIFICDTEETAMNLAWNGKYRNDVSF